jgi:hypothetical protein
MGANGESDLAPTARSRCTDRAAWPGVDARRATRGDRDPLDFRPGSQYQYFNTDNFVVALMAQAVTHTNYARC